METNLEEDFQRLKLVVSHERVKGILSTLHITSAIFLCLFVGYTWIYTQSTPPSLWSSEGII